MRPEVLQFVARSIAGVPPGRALDVGSYDVNGTARPTFEAAGWRYVGFDANPGPNVDLVGDIQSLHDIIAISSAPPFDCVACLETLEHLQDPIRAVDRMREVLRPGGLLILTAAGNGFPEHRYPLDCWRILPDGMRFLLAGMGGVVVEEFAKTGWPGILGKGVKP